MVDTVDTVEHGAGNTKIRSRGWCFTLNNHTKDDITHLTHIFKAFKCRYVFQEETGENGTPHLQGMFYFENARSFGSVKALHSKMHLEKMRDLKSSIAYCSKVETRTGSVFVEGFKIVIVKDPMEGLDWHVWQQGLKAYLHGEPDNRKIHWYWEATGNVGKTTLCKHLCMTMGALYVSGKADNIKFAIAKMTVKPKIVLFDCPRSMQGYLSYQAIESVKNGIFFSGKYESEMVMFNPPHIICFANYPPAMENLSADRWMIHPIGPIDMMPADIEEYADQMHAGLVVTDDMGITLDDLMADEPPLEWE